MYYKIVPDDGTVTTMTKIQIVFVSRGVRGSVREHGKTGREKKGQC